MFTTDRSSSQAASDAKASPPDAPSTDARRETALWLAQLVVPLCMLWIGWKPNLGQAPGTWHVLLDLASLLSCAMVVAMAWHARTPGEWSAELRWLAGVAFVASLLELTHLATGIGLGARAPLDGLSGDDTVFFFASRLLIAVSLLCVAALQKPPRPRPLWLIGATCGAAAGLAAAWSLATSPVPTLASAGSAGSAATLLALLLAAAALLGRRAFLRPSTDAVWLLLSATGLMAAAETMLVFRDAFGEDAISIAHVYRFLAFWTLCRSVAIHTVRLPTSRLIAAREELKLGQDELRTITDNLPAMVAFVDMQQRYRFVNRNYEHWLGVKPEAMIGHTPREIFGTKNYSELQGHMDRAFAGHTFHIQQRIAWLDPVHGQWLDMMYLPKLDVEGRVLGVYILTSDITGKMRAEHRALFLAEHDELTTLPNRATFQLAVNKSIERSTRHAGQFAVIIVDVDRFKVVNDTLGHTAGDHLLQELAGRMRLVVRGDDLVARMGGDEMCLLLHDVRDASHASEIAERILAALRVPVELRNGVRHHVTVSAGIAIYPQDGIDVQTLLRHADIAMYRAKAAGRDGFALFGSHDGGPAEKRLNLELELRTAIDSHQFVLHYQPRIHVFSGETLGTEALVRWQHPVRGLLAPSEFIAIAEETGLIVPMGAWVLAEAGRMLRRLHEREPDRPPLSMSVNVSARQFNSPQLVDEVTAMLALAGCAPHLIELELTESAVMDQPDLAEATMRRLKALGVRLSMDDFGTGYSSLAALKRFPVDCVKIDRSFVEDIPGNTDDVALTRAIIAMGRSLGLHVVAEGVERADQLEFLRREGCDEYQGYHFARPMAEAELIESIAQAARGPLAKLPRG